MLYTFCVCLHFRKCINVVCLMIDICEIKLVTSKWKRGWINNVLGFYKFVYLEYKI